ncbi:hypothetical protein FHS18_005566 [Paenibacillus phyllosphaerae]|uniref:Thioredoxin-like fold domain-containing protein n=1 Tax=Paenibacillus phyllosphaerae TaxID=274593 RepID=A0A7W5B3F7_9BACL|nr:thioredoxin family protein [Paenibacillus phyllosphaerae]MBB3113454.1 hypothetical protein [Paenibacillus phyllosphaerae]
MSKTIEIFKDGSPQLEELEALVRELTCPRCSNFVYNTGSPGTKSQMQAKAAEYGIESWPAVTLDGKAVSPEQLKKGKVAEIVRNLFHK